RKGLASFVKGAFQENPYQETPVLRGVFFTSGRQEGTPHSHFLNALGLISEREVLPGTNRGLFLHDFFSKVLPRDRGLFAPTRGALEWRSLTRNLGLTSWVILGIALCGLLSFSFAYNLKLLKDVSISAKLPPAKGEILADMESMARFRESILELDAQKRKLWVRFGLDEAEKVSQGLKEKYVAQFRARFLDPLEKQAGAALAGFSASTPDDIIGRHVVFLIRRVQVLKARQAGEDFTEKRRQVEPAFLLVSRPDPAVEAEVNKTFGNLYVSYLAWQKDGDEIGRESNLQQTRLRQLLALRGTGLQWVAAWVNTQSAVAPVGMKEFWGGSGDLPGEKAIAPAYTRKGKDLIDSFIAEMETAVPDRAAFGKQKEEFERWYRAACYDAWQGFGMQFLRGSDRLRSPQEWQQAATRMATEQGPYFALMNRMTIELEPVAKDGNLPPWLTQAYQLQAVKAAAAVEGKGTPGKLVDQGMKLLWAVKKPGEEKGQDYTQGTKAHQEYLASLTAVAASAASRNQAFQAAAQVFAEEPSTGKSPFYTAQGALARMNTALRSRSGDDLFWRVLGGPLDFYWKLVCMEADCSLQSQWEEKVLAEAQGAAGPQAQQLLLGPDGLAWKFVRGPAAPFLARSLKGFTSKEALGSRIPFDPSFLNYLVKGAQASAQAKKSYAVTIGGLPTSANAEARSKPQATRLELQCSTGPQILENFNYPVNKNFTWTPESCADVNLQIEIGSIQLRKKYSGDQAFPEFLQDFRFGQHVFSPADFPAEKTALESMGVKSIRVQYQFGGEHGAALGQLGAVPRQAPLRIVACWGK
ncbi:MAG TPA: type VI secretion system protein, partial [Thermodesulfobacteriota bacterium]|nr:type VI secretion system protein [Thermodesulfobacteriota bacterium]